MERIDFQGTDISGVLDRLPDEERNRLPFGVVKLDTQGVILSYNMAEAEISGVKPSDVIGKNFFLEVAVCTQRPEFYGRFRDAMDNDRVLNLIFDYEFQNARYAPVHDPIKVRVHMFTSYEIGGKKIVWLMVKRVASRQQARPQVNDVAATAAAHLGVPTLGQAQLHPAHIAPLTTFAFAPTPTPDAHPSYPAAPHGGFPPPVQYPSEPRPPHYPDLQHGAFPAAPAYPSAPVFPSAPAHPANSVYGVPTATPQRAPLADTNGADIVIRFDDV